MFKLTSSKISDMSKFLSFKHELTAHDVDLHPSELHGLMVGYVCGAGSELNLDQRRALYTNWLDADVPDDLLTMLDAAHDQAVENLDEFADFEFRLLIPADDQPIQERAMSIALWCSGFLSGLGESGRQIDQEQGDAAEALGVIARIAAMTDEVPEGEDNEEDLTEIEEFVRVSTLLVFAETRPGRPH